MKNIRCLKFLDSQTKRMLIQEFSSLSSKSHHIQTHCLSVIVSDHLFEVGLPFTWKVPWKLFTYFIPLHLDDLQTSMSLNSIGLIDNEQIDKTRKIMHKYAADVLWHDPNSRVVQNILHEAYHRCFRPLAK